MRHQTAESFEKGRKILKAIIKHFLSQHMDFTFFSIFLPNPMEKEAVLASGCVVLGCWLGLNHNIEGKESLRRERWELMWLQIGAENIWAISTSHKITTKTSYWKLVEAVLLSSYSCCINPGEYKRKHHCPDDTAILRSSSTTFPQPQFSQTDQKT